MINLNDNVLLFKRVNEEIPEIKRVKRKFNVFNDIFKDGYVKPNNDDLIKYAETIFNGDVESVFLTSDNKRKLIKLTELLYFFRIDELRITDIYDIIVKKYVL